MIANYCTLGQGSWCGAEPARALGPSVVFPQCFLYCVFEEAWSFETRYEKAR